ncbi:hypothetical protein D9M72_454830 [compost metagenome]
MRCCDALRTAMRLFGHGASGIRVDEQETHGSARFPEDGCEGDVGRGVQSAHHAPLLVRQFSEIKVHRGSQVASRPGFGPVARSCLSSCHCTSSCGTQYCLQFCSQYLTAADGIDFERRTARVSERLREISCTTRTKPPVLRRRSFARRSGLRLQSGGYGRERA